MNFVYHFSFQNKFSTFAAKIFAPNGGICENSFNQIKWNVNI